jgi:hypothetical protein
VAGDHGGFAALDVIEKFGQVCLCFGGLDFAPVVGPALTVRFNCLECGGSGLNVNRVLGAFPPRVVSGRTL